MQAPLLQLCACVYEWRNTPREEGVLYLAYITVGALAFGFLLFKVVNTRTALL